MTSLNDIRSKAGQLMRKIARLERKEIELRQLKMKALVELNTLEKALSIMKNQPTSFALPAPQETVKLFFSLNENTKLGDAIETILRTKGAMFRKDIIGMLREYRVRLSPKAPEQVLANAITRDKQSRFVILEDRRIALKKA